MKLAFELKAIKLRDWSHYRGRVHTCYLHCDSDIKGALVTWLGSVLSGCCHSSSPAILRGTADLSTAIASSWGVAGRSDLSTTATGQATWASSGAAGAAGCTLVEGGEGVEVAFSLPTALCLLVPPRRTVLLRSFRNVFFLCSDSTCSARLKYKISSQQSSMT